MKRIKNPIEFLLENGLIFEFNRTVLHPLGLSLEVDIRENDDNKTEPFLLLWECPENDKDGFIFPPDAVEVGREKYSRYLKIKNDLIESRKKSLGYIVQND